MKNRQITRTPVHIVINRAGGLYELSEDGRSMVNIRQIETWIENGVMKVSEKILSIEANIPDIRRNLVLPGNIIRGYTTETLGDEYIVTYKSGNPAETKTGELLYSFLYYEPSTTLLPIGELDENIEELLIT